MTTSPRHRDTVLIVTRSDDHAGIPAVVAAIEAAGLRAVRLDSDHFPTSERTATRLGVDETRRHFRVQTNTKAGAGTGTGAGTGGDGLDIDGGRIGAVWYRRFAAGLALPGAMGDTRGPAVDESRRSLYGTLAALGDDDGNLVPHLDRLEDVRRCDHKELQLLRARSLGLRIPETLFSNDVEAADAFIAEARAKRIEVITKMQSSFALYRGGEEHVVFTSVVDDEARAALAGLALCPMQFQHRIGKRLELRVTVVGDNVFCAAVDSQQAAETKVDWRKDGVGLLKSWTRYPLPAETSAQLLTLVRSFGLTYAAADFIVTPEDELVFLEINAGGEWFWLDEHQAPSPGFPIAKAIAAALVDGVRTGRLPGDPASH